MRRVMNWIKNTVLLGLSFGICVCLLIVGDWFIRRSMYEASKIQVASSEAKKIVQVREREEDIPQREKLVSQGFLPILYPTLLDNLDIKYPLIAGLPLTNTYYCNEGYGLLSYRSDRFGFRNEDTIWDKQTKAIMIGDSYVQGACVGDKDTLPIKLSEKINLSVINLGIGGNNPSHYFTYSYLFIPKLKPKIVYLNFYPNDNGVRPQSIIERKYVDQKLNIFSENTLALNDVSLFLEEGIRAMGLLKSKQQATEKENELNIIQKASRAFLRHSTLPTIRSIFDSRTDFELTKNFELTEKSITKTFNLCNKFNCEMIVSFIPNSEFYSPDPRADNYADNIAQLTTLLGIPFVDGRDIFDRNEGSQDYALKGPHLSPIGYNKMAKAIAEVTR